MDNTISSFLKIFESFFKRSVLPSSVLLLFLFISNKTYINIFIQSITPILKLEYSTYILTLLIIISLVALSFFMSIATQIIFDNRMKENFNGLLFSVKENNMLNLLRTKAIEKLEKEDDIFKGIEYTDYFLYQVIGRKLAFIKPETKTTRYIDDIKSSGIIFISLIITIIIKTIINFNGINLLIGIALIILIWFTAQEYLKSKYRSRAIRIYVNYLIGNYTTK